MSAGVITNIGLLGALVSTTSMFPQIVKVWKSKSAKDISMAMFLIMVLSVTLWLAYGLLSNDLPIVASNIVVFGQTITMLTFKLKYRDL